MQGSGIYEWVHKFVLEGVVNHPNLGIKFITYFVRLHVTSCHSTCSWINVHHLEKSVSYPMIPNVRGSVADYANEKCVYAGRCLGPINRPWPVARLISNNLFLGKRSFKIGGRSWQRLPKTGFTVHAVVCKIPVVLLHYDCTCVFCFRRPAKHGTR